MRTALLLLLLAPQEPSLDDLIRRLGDESPDVRDRADRAIFERGESAIEPLTKALVQPDPEVRGRIQGLLFRLQWKPRVPGPLLARAPEARAAFESGAHALFIQLCRDRRGWDDGGNEELEAYAINLLGHADLELRKEAIPILESISSERHRIRRKPVAALVGLLGQWDPEAWDDPDESWLQRLTSLIDLLSSPRDRAILVNARAHPKAEKALTVLRAGTGDGPSLARLPGLIGSETVWRHYALRVVARRRYAPARDAVAKRLDSQDGWAAWEALGGIWGASLAGPVVAAARKTPAGQRGPVQFRILASIGTPEAIALIVESLESDDRSAGPWAATVLGEAGVRSAFDALCEGIGRKNTGIHCAQAVAALADGETIDRLLEPLDRPNSEAGRHAFAALDSVVHPEARRKVLRRFEAERDPARRKEFFRMICGLDDEGTFLEKLAASPSDPLAPAAAAGLLRLRGARALPFAEALVESGAPDEHFLACAPAREIGRLARKASDIDLQYFILPRLEELGAKDEIAKLLPRSPTVVSMSLLRAGGDGLPGLKAAGDEVSWGEADDLAERGVPGIRELLRERMKAADPDEAMLQALRNWAHPEMIPVLSKRLARYDAGRSPDIGDPRGPELCAMTLPQRNWGYDALSALGAAGERALLIERLRDPETGMQATAIRWLAKGKVKEAVPALRQIVLSGRAWIRGKALAALAEIGAPGTVEFIRAHLRDNPHAAPHALARMGVDARDDLLALLDDRVPAGPILGALDLMANRAAYGRIDAPMPRRFSRLLEALPATIERVAGRPCRLSPEVARRQVLEETRLETLRDLFEQFESDAGWTHVFRDGAIEICTVDEARDFWTRPK